MSKQILVFGAGKSAGCLIDYLISEAGINHWTVTVADNNLAAARSKTGDYPYTQAVCIDIENAGERTRLIQTADIVISLLPPAMHFLVAKDCVLFAKNLLTASYTDNNMRSLREEIEKKKLLFLCEMGLDPGIDHMSAMQLIHRIQNNAGSISHFISHCGGLVAPETDDNPWHYKISWNPRNVVMAGKAGAVYKLDGNIKQLSYNELFDETRLTNVPGIGSLAWYPNRDSLEYIDLYKLHNATTFIRTTLRYPAFCAGWKQLINLRLTNEDSCYETDGMNLETFFRQHFEKYGHPGTGSGKELPSALFMQQLEFLGLHDAATFINKGKCSTMDVLQFALEKKLLLGNNDRDMIIMLHEIIYAQNDEKYNIKSHLIVKGEDNIRTAMAKTVGLPLGIAAKLILQGKIKETGLHIPVIPSIYIPVLAELEFHGILFHENTERIQ
jgi:saccharopine dehydrogenase-like NADP-dependent oxidoreductase